MNATPRQRIVVIAPTYVHARAWMQREGIPPERVVYGRSIERLRGFSPTGPYAPRVVRIVVPGQPLPEGVLQWMERWRALGGEIESTRL